ncbi:M1 family metallopeptidase [Flavobacterium restrictum]|uniref:Aminopeptidase N n=1 Tax=Flavobacterium restrictum TaxID=2594428 RepID=A0A553DXR2_9FLAO|nr:M1 family metallopeptidase [Flavobacterium restrictum]TRX37492.1 M1 family metallopeptidase [Flavobacterium restrictum]
MKYFFIALLTSITFAQQTKSVNFLKIYGQVTLDPTEKSISGTAGFWFDVLKPTDTIKIDAQNMTVGEAELNEKAIAVTNNGKQLLFVYPFKKGKNFLTFSYKAVPKQALYFVGSEKDNNLQIWTQGQGRYTSNWFPSFDDVNEKAIFNLTVVFDSKYRVISNGLLQPKVVNNGKTYWNYTMRKPMSSYLLLLSIGKFDKKTEYSNSKIPLEMYFEPKDAPYFEPTYRDSKLIFDFLESEIGVSYPWKIYRQVPVRDFLYAGMENTSATLFSTRYVVDSTGYADRSYTNVNAHELAHQWFGDLITAQTGQHHWLQEGFATYYALLAEKKIYGDDYFYAKLYESEQQLKYASRTDTIPVLNAKASSLTFYQKGAWALFVLHHNIGDKAFRKAVKSYLKKHSFQTVTTTDFFDEIKKVSAYDVAAFSKTWLESTVFNTAQANALLQENKAMQLQFEVDQLKDKPLAEKYDFFKKVLQSDVFYTVKEAVVRQLKDEKWVDKKELFELALQTNSIPVRQTVASVLSQIPPDFRVQYESLLTDKSYQTQEIALYNLWNNFPEKDFVYLDQSKNWMGFNDYNLKTLWLSLALSTPNYATDKAVLMAQLIQYSSPNYEATTRQNALQKLIAFHLANDTVLINLVNATTHHMWQFSKFGRDAIRILLKNPMMKTAFERILPQLNEKEQLQLNRLLKE